MPSRLVICPNGRYARFSTVVDNFTHYDMTEDEAFALYRDEAGVQAAREKIERAQAAITTRFEEGLSEVAFRHGKREANRMRKLMSQKGGE